jgi:hypothetical protein
MWFKWITGEISIFWDRVGQLWESGEYWMRRRMSGLIWNSEFQGGSPDLSWLRTGHLTLVSKFELCTGTYGISCGPANWVASCVTETEAILLDLTGVHRDTTWASHVVSAEASAWKTCTRVRWALIASLTASWTIVTHGAPFWPACAVLSGFYLARFKLARVFAIPSDMGNTCPL